MSRRLGPARRASRPVVAVAAAAVLALASGCTGGSEEEPRAVASTSAAPAPVDLGDADARAESSVDEITLGVVVTLGSEPGEGEEWKEAAEGARVAAYRYSRGEVAVTLDVRNDTGSSDGAVSVVRGLVDDGVAGIVMATAGAHMDDALRVAQRAQVPVVLPFDAVPGAVADGGGVYSLAPSDQVAGETLASVLASRGLELPYVIDVGGGVPEGLEDYAERRVSPADDPAPLLRLVRQSVTRDGVDAVLLSGPPESQATLLVALQGTTIDLPVLLTPDALSPAFSATLTEAEAPLSGDLTTVGADNGDLGAMTAGPRGDALAAFFAALRAAVDDDAVTTFFDERPFLEVAEDVDTRAHDAVVILVEAARAADSTDPDAVLQAMQGLRLGDGAGLAGPAVDLGSPQVVPPSAVVPLQSTIDDPGLRPVDPDSPPRLHWFAVPDTETGS